MEYLVPQAIGQDKNIMDWFVGTIFIVENKF